MRWETYVRLERERERESEKEIERETERDRERQREIERDREAVSFTNICSNPLIRRTTKKWE